MRAAGASNWRHASLEGAEERYGTRPSVGAVQGGSNGVCGGGSCDGGARERGHRVTGLAFYRRDALGDGAHTSRAAASAYGAGG